MSETPAPCRRQQELIDEVQVHLIRIAELSRATGEALANGNENLALEFDRQAEKELGMKERAMGALHEHRTAHGC
jgi:hypothetical protein